MEKEKVSLQNMKNMVKRFMPWIVNKRNTSRCQSWQKGIERKKQ